MRYLMNDVELDLPEGGIDTSVNVLFVPVEGGDELVLTIAREPRSAAPFADQARALLASVEQALAPEARQKPRWGSLGGRAVAAVELRLTTERGPVIAHHVLVDGGAELFALALTGPARLALPLSTELDRLLGSFVTRAS